MNMMYVDKVTGASRELKASESNMMKAIKDDINMQRAIPIKKSVYDPVDSTKISIKVTRPPHLSL